MHDDTRTLVDQMIQDTKGRAIYLAVREICDKTRTSQTASVLADHPEIWPFTLGVFTKCDDTSRKKILSKMKEDSNLQHGYVATMNAPPDEVSKGVGLFAQADEEIQYFVENNLQHLLDEK